MFSYSAIAEKSRLICCSLAIVVAITAPISTAIAGVACIALLLAWLISGQVWQNLKISAAQPVGKMLLVFIAWLVIGSFYADTSWADKLTTLSSWKKLFYAFVLLGFFGQTQWKTRFINYYLAAMAVAAVVAVAFWLLDIQVRGHEVGIIMTNHSSQSIAFMVAALCCLFLFEKSLSPGKKALLATMLSLFVVNVFFVSVSRSGYLALPVAAVFLVVNLCGYKKLPHILGLTIAAVLLAVLTSSTLQQSVLLGLEESKNAETSESLTSIGVRDMFRQNTLELIWQKPVLGYGTSAFEGVYSAHVAAKYQDWRGEPASDPHNQYLFVWLENGLVGLLLFLAYIYIAIKQGLKQGSYGVIAASVLVAFAATGLFNSHFKTFPEGHLLAFFVGCLLARQPTPEAEKDHD